MSNEEIKTGRVSYILSDGYGYVQPDSLADSSYVFSFSSIPDYRGETARELNLYKGSKVEFKLQGQNITSLRILSS